MRAPKSYFPNTVIFVTCSLEQGILLLPNPLCKLLILSCLGLAQKHHPIKICHYFVSGNHIHFIIYVENPDDIRGFFERFKTESAFRLNSLLGRRQISVWCKGFDSPTILDPETVVDRIAYIYSNPSKDNLEDSIDRYPGLNSWQAFNQGYIQHKTLCPYVSRTNCPYIGTEFVDYQLMAEVLSEEAEFSNEFVITPNAWLKAFKIPESKSLAIKQQIVSEVRRRESLARELRKQESKSVIGREAMLKQALDPYHLSSRDGKRMLCLAASKNLRKQFIAHIESLKKLAKKVQVHWKLGDFSQAFPLGLFPPMLPKLADSTLFFFSYPIYSDG